MALAHVPVGLRYIHTAKHRECCFAVEGILVVVLKAVDRPADLLRDVIQATQNGHHSYVTTVHEPLEWSHIVHNDRLEA